MEARKSVAVGVLYGACALVSGCALAYSIISKNVQLIIYGGILVAVCLGVVLDYLRTPMRPFSIDGHDRLVLHNGIVLDMKDVWDVSYRQAAARGMQYFWGSVTVVTEMGTFKYGYISDCEWVAKSLLHRVYAHRAAASEEL